MIATGRQIAAARALLGWSQDKLAEESKLHPNSIAYWERHDEIETGEWRAPSVFGRHCSMPASKPSSPHRQAFGLWQSHDFGSSTRVGARGRHRLLLTRRLR